MEFRRTTYEDVLELAVMMRQSDRDEVWAAHHLTPEQAAVLCFRQSPVCYTVKINGAIIVMFGVAPLGYRDGVSPWMLSTDELLKIPVTFYRESLKHLTAMTRQYDYLENYVDKRNILSIRWLRWLGFTIHDAELYGIDQLPFHKFTMGV